MLTIENDKDTIRTSQEPASAVSDAGSGTSERSVPAYDPPADSSVPSRVLSRRTPDTPPLTLPSHPSVFCNETVAG